MLIAKPSNWSSDNNKLVGMKNVHSGLLKCYYSYIRIIQDKFFNFE
jgi:hypothetical protein